MRHITPVKRNQKILKLVNDIYKQVKKDHDLMMGYDDLKKEFMSRLRKAGFKYITGGGYKHVYRHPDFPEFVVKIFRDAYSHNQDTLLYRLPSFLRKYFLYPIYKNRVYIIQPRADGVKGKWKKSAYTSFQVLLGDDMLIEEAAKMDVCYNNIKYHNGNPVVIDFLR